jgi:isopentenyldiphosphate isomerase
MNTFKTNQPVSDEEIEEATRILSKFEPGYMPFPLFLALTRLVVHSIIEIVPVRYNEKGTLEVLLLQRDKDDILWPSMWHNPGCVVLATDLPEGDEAAFRRIAQNELDMNPENLKPVYVSHLVHRTRRGAESAKIFFAELTTIPKNGSFFAADALPDGTIESHVPIIMTAVAQYRAMKEEVA